MHGDRIVAAVQEERLAGKKRARLYGSRPSLAVRYCLDEGGITANQLDIVVLCAQTDSRRAENAITNNPMLDIVANGIPTQVISHHAGHAVSAFATSGFDEAAAMIIDGMGSPTSDLSADERSAIIGPGGGRGRDHIDLPCGGYHPYGARKAHGRTGALAQSATGG